MKELALSIGGTPIPAPSEIKTPSLDSLVALFVTLLLLTAVILALFFLILGGVSWITSEGDKQKLQSARLKITYAIIGLVVVFLSFFLINLISDIFGIQLIQQLPIPGTGGPHLQ